MLILLILKKEKKEENSLQVIPENKNLIKADYGSRHLRIISLKNNANLMIRSILATLSWLSSLLFIVSALISVHFSREKSNRRWNSKTS